MHRVIFGFAVSLLAACFAFVQSPADKRIFYITHVTVIDATGAPAQTDMTVEIQDGRIAKIAKTGKINAGASTHVVDARGKFLIPGLWDMHVHTIFGDWLPGGREITLPLFVANGVTGVRDMGGELETLLEWRKEIGQGKLLGPRMIVSGPMLDGPQPRFPSSVAIRTPEDGRKAVDDIAEEARKQGIPFAGHVPDTIRASEASNAGQKSFEHLIGIFEGSSPLEGEFLKGPKGIGKFMQTFDDARAHALAALLAKNHTWQCPTLVWERGGNLLDGTDFASDTRVKYAPSAWKDVTWKRFSDEIRQGYATDDLATRKRFVQKELDVVNLLHRAGVQFLTGTDTAAGVRVFPGFSLHEELQLFVKAGFTPMEALQTATLNPAKYLGMQDRLGTIEKGKLADLVLLDANPLEDIANTQKIAAVFLNGRYFSRADLDKILEQVENAARGN